ncbi:MAG: gamma-glutamyltransferase, partial [Chitinophagales bacterium]
HLFTLAISLFSLFPRAKSQGLPDAYNYKITKSIDCKNGAVVSAHPLASQAGLAMLTNGGNAIDAAIATQFALAVVYPGAGNIGGGGFLVAFLSGGKTIAIDFREKAPHRAYRDMFLDAKRDPIPGLSENGHLASGVPGAVAGIFAVLKYAKLPIQKLIAPAIALAENGFVITEAEARNLNGTQSLFKKNNSIMPVFVKESGWKEGDTLYQKDLAKTLKRIRDNGAKGFYEGETAKLIVEEMKRGNGLIDYEDLKTYDAKERDAVNFKYKGMYTILTMPLPSSGGVMLPQMMKMVENRPLKSFGFESVRAVHLMAEVERYSFADRAKWLGDRDFYRIPVKTLTSESYLAERMKLYNPDSAGNSLLVQAGEISSPESEETTHFDVYDKDGNCVSVTTTLNGGYGSKTVVGGAGFLMNNEMDDFSIKPGTPNMYGAVGGEANAIAPGKRMLSSMTPAIVLKNGAPYIIVGTPGGTTIPTSVFQSLVDILEFDMSPQDAVNKPKFHHQWLPDELFVEKDFPKEVQEELKKMGYKISVRSQIGRTELIFIRGPGQITAVGDKRGDDAAAGY